MSTDHVVGYVDASVDAAAEAAANAVAADKSESRGRRHGNQGRKWKKNDHKKADGGDAIVDDSKEVKESGDEKPKKRKGQKKSRKTEGGVEQPDGEIRRSKRRNPLVIIVDDDAKELLVGDAYRKELGDGFLQRLHEKFFFFSRDLINVGELQAIEYLEKVVSVYYGSEHNHSLFEKFRLRSAKKAADPEPKRERGDGRRHNEGGRRKHGDKKPVDDTKLVGVIESNAPPAAAAAAGAGAAGQPAPPGGDWE
eukprot:TRINITY_DN394_c0_g1_i1.p1 TRINITY_DN394_c0_g1~~TRINITY_DN394_c0_g1_i1.p1  ORF type:complete len:252 (+),score=83.51 TRINITY_DN394_c0_g1_i1:49-804(+)